MVLNKITEKWQLKKGKVPSIECYVPGTAVVFLHNTIFMAH